MTDDTMNSDETLSEAVVRLEEAIADVRENLPVDGPDTVEAFVPTAGDGSDPDPTVEEYVDR